MSNKTERRARVEQVMLAGHWGASTTSELAYEFGVTEDQIKLDRDWVFDQWEQTALVDDQRLNKLELLKRSRALYHQALRHNQYQVAHSILRTEAQLTGAFEPLSISVQGSFKELSDIELAKRILDPAAIQWAQKILVEDAAAAFFYDLPNDHELRSDIKGYADNPAYPHIIFVYKLSK